MASSYSHTDQSAATRRSPSPTESFAQTGAEFTLDDDDDDDFFSDDDTADLRAQVDGGSGGESYQLKENRNGTSRAAAAAQWKDSHSDDANGYTDDEDDDVVFDAADDNEHNGARRFRQARSMSASTVASFQLYTPDEEQAVRRKFDRKLVLFVALLYMLSFLDRSNIGNARIAGMDADLRRTSPPRDDWYELSLTAFYASYILFEWMALLWKVIPAHIYIASLVMSWGAVASLQAVAISYPMLVVLRVLLGIGEAGFTGIPFYLSFFFKRDELAFRTAIFISAAPLATTFASTLAWLIVKVGEMSPIRPWRLLFLIEGFPSVLVAVIAWNVIPDSPQTASYLTKREKKVARLRLRREKPASSARSTSSGLKFRELLAVLRDPVAYLTAAIFFLTNMAYSSLPVFLPKIMFDMGHDALTAQALSAPPYLVAFLAVLFTAHMSDRLRTRAAPIAFHAAASALGYAVLALAELLHLPAWLRYLAIYPAAVGFFNVVTLVIAWNINNQASESRQGGGFAMLQIIGQCGPLVGTRLYPDADAPYYTPGMVTCAGAMAGVAFLALLLRWYLGRLNRKMDAADSQRVAAGDHGGEEEEEGLVEPRRRRTSSQQAFRYML